jgi:hypothetical protein
MTQPPLPPDSKKPLSLYLRTVDSIANTRGDGLFAADPSRKNRPPRKTLFLDDDDEQ